MKKKILAVLAVSLVGLVLLQSAMAYQEDLQGETDQADQFPKFRNFMNPERSEQMKEQMKANHPFMDSEIMGPLKAAVEAQDYALWVQLHEENDLQGLLFEVITEENFPLLQQLHDARENVKEIASELGLEPGKNFRGRMHKGLRNFQGESPCATPNNSGEGA